MKRYEFRLNRVKRVRHVAEDLARAAFGAAEAKAREAEARVDARKAAVDRAVDELRGLQGSPKLAPQSVITALGLVDDARRVWFESVEAAQGLRQKAEDERRAWIAARREVDALERLDERSRAEYVLERERSEALVQDDTASQRDARARRAAARFTGT